MAGSWTLTPRKHAVLAGFDRVVGWLYRRLAPRRVGVRGPPERILVLEPWHIGDVVLATAALAAARAAFPRAYIALLAQPHAVPLLESSGLADEVIAYRLPWTSFRGKYLPWRLDLVALVRLVLRLRRGRFDLTLDPRGDIRQNLIVWLAGARRRVGYLAPGGAFLLTDALRADRSWTHKVDDWLALLRHVGGAPADVEPVLRVSPAERAATDILLAQHGIGLDDVVLALHVGASHAVKRWDAAHFAAVADDAVERCGVRVVVVVDPDGYGADLPLRSAAVFLRPSLGELRPLLARADVLLCNDSGPMHVAAAAGTRVVAVFTSGHPEWYGPRGAGHRVIHTPDVACRPCYNYCPLPVPICNTSVARDAVRQATLAALAELAGSRDAASADVAIGAAR